MAEKLTPDCNKTLIFDRVQWLMGQGSTMKKACKIVEKEHGQKWQTTQKQYQREKSHGPYHWRRAEEETWQL